MADERLLTRGKLIEKQEYRQIEKKQSKPPGSTLLQLALLGSVRFKEALKNSLLVFLFFGQVLLNLTNGLHVLVFSGSVSLASQVFSLESVDFN